MRLPAMKSFILAIDQSTSGTKVLVVDKNGNIVAKSAAEHKQLYPAPGWVEHDPLEIYDNVKSCALEAIGKARIEIDHIATLTITNQRETAVMWDRTTGLPVYNAIVWQCQRTAEQCARLKAAGHEASVKSRTGLRLDPYFSAAKWRWILDHVGEARQKLAQGRLLAGTIDSWLVWKLTGGCVHATDYTNASRTSLYNIHALEWDEEMCGLFGVSSGLLPEVKSSDEIFGYTDTNWIGASIPITGVIGDSQAALFGNLCLEQGMAKATYGTGTSVLMNVGGRPVDAGQGVVQAIAWGKGGIVTYALEAVIRTSGDSIKWIRDKLGLFDTFEEFDRLLQDVPHNEGVYLVPAFVGLGAPYWEPDARAAIIGLNRSSGKSHIIRAALESIAYQVRDAVELLQSASGIDLRDLRADGEAANNPVLMQFQADILNREVLRSGITELSAMGSAFMGGLGIGFWSSLEDLAGLSREFVCYEPAMDHLTRASLYDGWKSAIASVLCGLSHK